MKISRDGCRVAFTSREPWFQKEKQGLKCNTIRKLICSTDEHEKFLSSLFTLAEIEIMELGTNQAFVRTLSDVSYYDGVFIFSWYHREE